MQMAGMIVKRFNKMIFRKSQKNRFFRRRRTQVVKKEAPRNGKEKTSKLERLIESRLSATTMTRLANLLLNVRRLEMT